MKEFVKTTSGLVDVSADKVKNFADLAAVCAAIANGDLAENEWWSTVSPVQASGSWRPPAYCPWSAGW